MRLRLLLSVGVLALWGVSGFAQNAQVAGPTNVTLRPGAPGYNLGNADFGPTGATIQYLDQRAMYVRGQGNAMVYGGIALNKDGDGDLNGISLYQSWAGACSDASCEGYTGLHVYPAIGATPLMGSIASGGTGATSLVLAGSNQGSFGTNRIVIDTTDDVQHMSIVSSVPQKDPSMGNSYYALARVNTSALPVSVRATLAQDVVTPTDDSFPATSETVRVSTPSALAPGMLCSFFGRIEQAKITAAGSWTGGSQSITVPLRYAHRNGTALLCGGMAGRAYEYPADTAISGVRHVFVVLGSPAANQIVTATMSAGGMSFEYQGPGAITVYHASRITKPIDATHLSVMDNDAAWSAGAGVEVVNGEHQMYKGLAMNIVDNNPYSYGDPVVIACPPGSLGCGSKNRAARFHVTNQNTAEFYVKNGLQRSDLILAEGPWYSLLNMDTPPGDALLQFPCDSCTIFALKNHTAFLGYDVKNGGNGEWNLRADRVNLPHSAFDLLTSSIGFTAALTVQGTDGAGAPSLTVLQPRNSNGKDGVAMHVKGDVVIDGNCTVRGVPCSGAADRAPRPEAPGNVTGPDGGPPTFDASGKPVTVHTVVGMGTPSGKDRTFAVRFAGASTFSSASSYTCLNDRGATPEYNSGSSVSFTAVSNLPVRYVCTGQ